MVKTELSRRHLLSLGFTSSIWLLSSCAAIPSNGTVNHYANSQEGSGSSSGQTVSGPVSGATQEEIIRGFLHAGIGSNDDYSVARQFLTEEFAALWKPDEATYVYSNNLGVVSTQNQIYSVTVPVSTQVNSSGIATSSVKDSEENHEFVLELVGSEWRISSAPNCLILDQSEFEQSFSPFTLYFYDPTFTYAVPDIRWFADRSTAATSLVRVLLEGPATYLSGAAKSALPSAASLIRNSVPVENSTAVVSLTGDDLATDITQLQIERIYTQLSQTLTPISGIEKVQLQFDDRDVSVESLQNYIEPQINPVVPQNIVGVEGQNLVLRSDVRSESNSSLAYSFSGQSASYTALSYNRQSIAFLNFERTELFLVRDSQARSVMVGRELTNPSFDQFQWLWSAQEKGTVQVVLATNNSSSAETVKADWLAGIEIASLKISRDGVRAAIAAEADGSYFLWISGIQRDSDNRPVALNEPVRVGTSIDAQYAAWASDHSLFVANFDTGESELVYLSGELTRLSYLESMAQVAVASGAETIVAQTQDQTLYLLAEQNWSRVESPLSSISYSG